MKLLIVLLSVAAVVSARPGDDTYDSRYDEFDVGALIGNKRLLQSAADCIIDKGKCTRDVEYFKQRLPEGIQTYCGKCSDKQKVKIATIIKALREQLPVEYKIMYDKFADPTHNEEKLNEYLNQYAQ